MRDAEAEMSHYHEFDFVVVNDDFELALDELRAIIRSQRLAISRQQISLQGLIKELLG